MYCVTIALGNTAWRLMFKTEEAATDAYILSMRPDSPENPMGISIQDDFGQRFSARVASIHGVMLEDLDKAKMANVELFLHQQRVQAMATKAAQADPGLRANAMMNGPAILDPMGRIPTN